MTASVPTWNKGKAPAGDTGWNLTPDVRAGLESMNVVVPVATGAERDGVTPPAGKYAGMVASRAEVPGSPLETYDGTNWHRQGPKMVPAAASQVGAALPVTAFTTGILAPIIQAGSAVLTTDSSGYFSVNYPQAFPSGVLCLIFTNGDSAQGRDLIISTAGSPITQTLGTGFGSVVNSAGALLAAGTTIRVNYVAVGW